MDDIQVSVERVDGQDGGVTIAVGTEVETGKPVRFAGDWRPMQAIAEALEEGEEVITSVPSWAVLSRG